MTIAAPQLPVQVVNYHRVVLDSSVRDGTTRVLRTLIMDFGDASDEEADAGKVREELESELYPSLKNMYGVDGFTHYRQYSGVTGYNTPMSCSKSLYFSSGNILCAQKASRPKNGVNLLNPGSLYQGLKIRWCDCSSKYTWVEQCITEGVLYPATYGGLLANMYSSTDSTVAVAHKALRRIAAVVLEYYCQCRYCA